jgi:hypothetical protein
LSETEPPPTNGDNLLEKLEHIQHWWREPLAGIIAVGLGSYDTWTYGRDAGFTSSVDEILILTGITLIAGIRNLFGSKAPDGDNKPP